MKAYKGIEIYKVVQNAKLHELVIVSVILLPMIIGGWVAVFNSVVSVELLGKAAHDKYRVVIICGLILVYLIGLIWAKRGQLKEQDIEELEENFENAKELLKSRLENRKKKLASYDSIEYYSNSKLTAATIEELLTKYPLDFTRISIKGGLPGVKLRG